MKSRLSAKRQQIVDFILQFSEEKGYPPTVRDIQGGCGISSTSVVDYHLKVLEKGGHLRRDPDVSRGIGLPGRTAAAHYMVPVPVVGQIAAGEPIPVPGSETWQAAAGADFIEVNAELTQGKPDIYALKVRGMSMIDALINDGDMVLMQSASTVDNGDMAAVWLRSEKEVTLKKVYMEPGRVRLQPANSQMKPIYTSPENVEVQGRVIAVIRQM
jgi:repressor LexA